MKTEYVFDILSRGEKVFDSKSISSLSDLNDLIFYFKMQGFLSSEIPALLSDFQYNIGEYGINREEWVNIVLKNVNNSKPVSGSYKGGLSFFASEIQHIKNIPSTDVRKILFLSLFIYKWNNHPTGWIRFSQNSLFDFWKLKYPPKKKNAIIKECCKQGMELRVVGSKSPVVCFGLNFQQDKGEEVFKIEKLEDVRSCFSCFIGDYNE